MSLINNVLLAVIVVIAVIPSSWSFSAGAPNDEKICTTLTPKHHGGSINAQVSSSPYQLRTEKQQNAVQITLSGKNADDVIRGFMVQGVSNGNVIGQFKIDPNDKESQALDCFNQKAVSRKILIHTQNIKHFFFVYFPEHSHTQKSRRQKTYTD